MSPATPLATPLPVGAAIKPNSLRAAMEARRARGERFPLQDAIALVVPLCLEIARHHTQGRRLFVHPSSILLNEQGHSWVESTTALPTLPRDRSCLAPEERSAGQPGDARSSVFSIGSILYELVTGESIGPGMRRPTEIVAQLPQELEVILGKALVFDPSHRPDDLHALASALHHVVPNATSQAPPPADESRLDHGDDFDVDVKLSMLPPPPTVEPLAVPRLAPLPDWSAPALGTKTHTANGNGAQQTPATRADPTSRLADLKARLESDPRPRYVVIQQGMDHGPFNAVELLQQIASHTFTEDSLLRDVFSTEERAIKDWEEFAPFAEQYKLNREIKAEKQEIERVIVAEKKATTSKALLGGILVAMVAGVGVLWFIKSRGARSDTVDIRGDQALSVDVDGGVRSAHKTTGTGRLPTQGAYPVLPGGMSCEAAQAKYIEEMKIGEKGAPDLTAGQFAAVLNKGTYLNSCGVPSDAKVNLCAAVQNGHAVGVTVVISPRNPSLESCVAGRVRAISFPSNPKLDVAHTQF